MAQLVNKQKLAELQGVSLPTVTRWLSLGMPVESEGGKGKGYKFDNAKVTAWRIEWEKKRAKEGGNDESEAAAKRRKLSAEADIAEMKAAETRGELCRQEDLIKDIQNDLAKVRARLLAIPVRAAPLVAGADERGARKVITDLIHEALDELSRVSLEEFEEPFEPDILLHTINCKQPEFYSGIQVPVSSLKSLCLQKCNHGSLILGRFSTNIRYDSEDWSIKTVFSL